jgi:hypothetical protein
MTHDRHIPPRDIHHVFYGRDGHSGAYSREPLGAILNWLLGVTGVL